MADPFTTTILKMQQLGFFKFLLPFIFTSAVFYGLLRKSQIFGLPEKNTVVNGVVALSAAFMIMAIPITQGIDPEKLWSVYFVQSATAILVTMVGIMLAGMIFPPDLPGHLAKVFSTKGGFWSIIMVGGLIVGLVILFTSGMSGIFFPAGGGPTWMSEDMLLTIGVIVVLMITVVVLFGLGGVSGGGGGGTK
jgi:hypothetical protein